MRFLRLDLTAYGPFTGRVLDFSRPNTRIHVVYGANEAGKSSTLRAILALLFGIPTRTTDDFVHHYPDLRLGARIEDGDGRIHDLVRRKGKAATLQDPEGNVLGDDFTKRLLGSVDKAFFRMMFGLDHQRLRQGGLAIAQGEGEVGMSLFAAAAGMTGLRIVLEEIENETSDLFKPTGRKPEINRAIADFKAERAAVRAADLSADQWDKLRRERGSLEKKMVEANAERRALQKERKRLERITLCLDTFAHLQVLRSDLDELSPVPEISEDARERRVKAEQLLERAGGDGVRLAADVERLEKAVEDTEVPEELLERETKITRLYSRGEAMDKALHDLTRLEAELNQFHDQIATLGRHIQPGVADVGRLLVPMPAAAKIRTLITDQAKASEKVRGSENTVARIERKRQRDEEALRNLPAARDFALLVAALKKARALGPLDQMRQEAEGNLKELKALAKTRLAALQLWSGALETLAALPLPSVETLDRHGNTIDALGSRALALEERIKEADGQIAKIDADLADLKAGGEIPTPEMVDQARQRRDETWSRIRAAYIDDGTPIKADRPMPDVYEGSVVEADDLADRRVSEATRVAQYAELGKRRQATVESRRAWKAERSRVRENLAAAESDWRQAWTPHGIDPLTPAEMQTWLQRRDKLAGTAEDIRRAKSRVAEVGDRAGASRERLGAALASVGEAPPLAEGSFEDSLDHTGAILERLQENSRTLAELRKRLAEHETTLAEARHERKEAEMALAAWRRDWIKALARIEQAPESTPAEVSKVLDLAADLERLVGEAATLRQRIDHIQADRDRFATDIQALLAATESDVGADDPITAARELHSQLQKAKRNQTKNAELSAQLENRILEKLESGKEFARAQDTLASLCRKAKCTEVADLPAIEARVARKRELLKDIADRQNELRRLGGGKPLDQVIVEVSDEDRDGLPVRINEVNEKIETLNEDRDALSRREGEITQELRDMDGGDESAATEQRAQETLALVREASGRYVRLKLSAVILRRTIERYRDSHQDPLLRRAGVLFDKLTGGSFSALKAEDDDGEPTLCGLCPDGKSVAVTVMSEATRDQLFLALRLAAIEAYLVHNEAMPFIADDLLINFDDDRAAAALDVLAELGARLQVLFFSHHAHLVELAESRLPPDALQVHQL